MGEPRWISNNQSVFLTQVDCRARTILSDPQRFAIPQADAEEFAESVKRFREIFQKAQSPGGRSSVSNEEKKLARQHVKRLMERIGNLVRTNRKLDSATKLMLDIRERSEHPKLLSCPQEPPELRFVRALHEGAGVMPQHELEFRAVNSSKNKPDGAVALQLFVDFIGFDEPVPRFPHDGHACMPGFWRSFTRSPIVYQPCLPSVPMIPVYWGRWEGSGAGTGVRDVGPFSRAVVGTMVGGTQRFLNPAFKPMHAPRPLPEYQNETRDVTIRVAVVEMQRKMMSAEVIETKQLEGPQERQREEREESREAA